MHRAQHETYDAWTWTPGKRWTRALVATTDPDARELHAPTVAVFSTVLAVDPNRLPVDDLADLAETVRGPIPDLILRRHHR